CRAERDCRHGRLGAPESTRRFSQPARRARMNITSSKVWSVLGTTLLAFAAGSASAQAPEKFTFALNWFAVGDHAAYWVALDKGYFTKAGLDVTLENSKGSGDSIAKADT